MCCWQGAHLSRYCRCRLFGVHGHARDQKYPCLPPLFFCNQCAQTHCCPNRYYYVEVYLSMQNQSTQRFRLCSVPRHWYLLSWHWPQQHSQYLVAMAFAFRFSVTVQQSIACQTSRQAKRKRKANIKEKKNFFFWYEEVQPSRPIPKKTKKKKKKSYVHTHKTNKQHETCSLTCLSWNKICKKM